jgi:hypothetical protein
MTSAASRSTAAGSTSIPRRSAPQYLERVKTHLKSIELTCGQMQADYVPVNTKTPVPEALFTYFSQRKV